MGRFIVKGGRSLSGAVCVSGSKNAALPIIFAALATRGVSRVYNLPDIGDVRDALGIIKELGATVRQECGITYVDTRSLAYTVPSKNRVSRIRASTYLIGACLVRFGRAELLEFGGCSFSKRPIDMHLDSAQSFGARLDGTTLKAKSLNPADIVFCQRSVGATVNALILAAGTSGVSHITGAAREPHISVLISYLISAGAKITVKDDVITVAGAELHGGTAVIPGDMIEAGTYLAASLVTDGRVRVSGFDPRELKSFTSVLRAAGTIEDVSGGSIMLVGRPKREISVTTGAYPEFPTDLQPILSSILATSRGGCIEERVWQTRFGYLDELSRLGVSFAREGSIARIFPSEIICGTAIARDLRGGAAAILLALSVNGESIIEAGECVLRGYEGLAEKLRDLGAEIAYEEKY